MLFNRNSGTRRRTVLRLGVEELDKRLVLSATTIDQPPPPPDPPFNPPPPTDPAPPDDTGTGL